MKPARAVLKANSEANQALVPAVNGAAAKPSTNKHTAKAMYNIPSAINKPPSAAPPIKYAPAPAPAPAPEESKTTEAVSSSTASTAAETTQNKNQTEASAPMVEEEEKEPDCE